MSEDLKKTTDNTTTENVENVEVLEVTPIVEKKSINNKKIKNTLHDIELRLLEEQNNDEKFPKFGVGDTIRVSVRITEGTKERVQVYEGVVLCFKHGMNRKTFMVRRVSAGISVERVFSFHSPYLAHIEIVRRAKVRRAKLYFLRGLFGKAARLKELALKKGENKKQIKI
ncbi:MAG: 50S ribosomal protein L19 [Spirochaetota bacterium]|nr:50S ribosomal protein L19 [Spirochaetota bacterium]